MNNKVANKVVNKKILGAIVLTLSFSSNLKSSDVIVVNNGDRGFVVKHTENGNPLKRDVLGCGQLSLIEGVNFDSGKHNIYIEKSKSSFTGKNNYEKFRDLLRAKFVKKGDKFEDYVVFIEKSTGKEPTFSVEKVDKGLIENIKKEFLPLVLKLKNFVSLDDAGINSLSSAELESGVKAMTKFKTKVGECNVPVKYYLDLLAKIDVQEVKFKEVLTSKKFVNLGVSVMSFGGNQVTKERTLQCSEKVETFREIFEKSENPEYVFMKKIGQESLESIRELELYTKKLILKGTSQVIEKIHNVCKWFVEMPEISDEKVQIVSSELAHIIRHTVMPIILKLEELLSLGDEKITLLSSRDINCKISKIEHDIKVFSEQVEKYSILESLCGEKFAKFSGLSKKLEVISSRRNMKDFEGLDLGEEEDRVAVEISKIINQYEKQDFKGLLGRMPSEKLALVVTVARKMKACESSTVEKKSLLDSLVSQATYISPARKRGGNQENDSRVCHSQMMH